MLSSESGSAAAMLGHAGGRSSSYRRDSTMLFGILDRLLRKLDGWIDQAAGRWVEQAALLLVAVVLVAFGLGYWSGRK